MCTTCGCGNPHSHTHIDENGNVVTHTHDHGDHDHNHAHGHTHSRTVSVEQDILARNNAIADENRALFAAKKILALNFVLRARAKRNFCAPQYVPNRPTPPKFSSLKAISKPTMTPTASALRVLRPFRSTPARAATSTLNKSRWL